jgi:formylglycine-generating enzyme required for sulfatase activity
MSGIRTKALATLPLALAIIAAPAASQPMTMTEFMKNRVERFAILKAQHPQQPEEIAQIQQRTAAIVAGLPPVSQRSLNTPSLVWRTTDAAVVILDIPVAPRMVVVPAGEFTMESLAARQEAPSRQAVRRRVRIDHAFAVGLFPIVVGEFASFVEETGYRASASCIILEQGVLKRRPGRSWRNPEVTALPRDPVTCVSYADGAAYAAWLSIKTGHQYRLMSEAEYEYINRAGTDTAYWWGDGTAEICTLSNGFDQDAPAWAGAPQRSTCHDGQAKVAQVGSYKSNPFGLFDTAGNVDSWVAGCWRAARAHTCDYRAVRGSSWISSDLTTRNRSTAPATEAASYRGFRLVRKL